MAVKIRWTKRAQKSFERIVDYLHAEWSLAVAVKFVNKSNAFIEILKDHPQIGKQEKAQKGLKVLFSQGKQPYFTGSITKTQLFY